MLDPVKNKDWLEQYKKDVAETNAKVDGSEHNLRQIQKVPIDCVCSSGKWTHPDTKVLYVEAVGNKIWAYIAVPVKTYIRMTDEDIMFENWWKNEDREFNWDAGLRFITCPDGDRVPTWWNYAGSVKIRKGIRKQNVHIFWEFSNEKRSK